MNQPSVIVPYRTDGSFREKLFDWNMERWNRLFNVDVTVADSTGEEFSRSEARNIAVKVSSGDILVIADADTVPIPAFVNAAIDLVLKHNTWVIAYDSEDYYNLSKHKTENYLKLSPMTPVLRPGMGEYDHKLTSWAGMIVMTREMYYEIGGYDERFIGWGYEDNAFQVAADTIVGQHLRVKHGYGVHLWHPIEPKGAFLQPNIEYNRRLYRSYEKARGNPDGMRSLNEGVHLRLS